MFHLPRCFTHLTRTQLLRTSTSKTQKWTTQEWTKPSAATLGVECQSSSFTRRFDRKNRRENCRYSKQGDLSSKWCDICRFWFQVGFLALFFTTLQPRHGSSLKMAWLSEHVCQTANLWNHSNTGTIAWENLKMIWVFATKKSTYVIMFIHTFTNMLLSTLLLVRKVHFLEYLWRPPSVPNPHLSGSWSLGWSNTMLGLHGSGFQGCSLACKLHGLGLASHQGFGPTPEWKPPQL